MSNVATISGLPSGTTPLSGTEAVPVWQSGTTVQVPASAFTGNSLPGTYTYATLPAASANTGKTAYTSDQGLVYSNGVAWVALSSSRYFPGVSRPLVALLAHSYGNNTLSKLNIQTYQVIDAFGTVKVTLTDAMLGAQFGGIGRVQGLGAPYDGICQFMSVDAGQVNLTFYRNALVGASGAVQTPTIGSAYLWDMGSEGATGGYSFQAYLSWARAFSFDAFMAPGSYMFFKSGGGIIPLFSQDPGLVGHITNLLAKSPLPQFAVVDLGVNDINSGQTLSAMQAAASAGIAASRLWGSSLCSWAFARTTTASH